MTNRLTIAIQSKGRLNESSIDFIRSLGIKFDKQGRNLISCCKNFDLNILYLRGSDIPEYVSRGIIDFGIVGEKCCFMKKILELIKLKV
jgi:ATP phosphoribosyltransferase